MVQRVSEIMSRTPLVVRKTSSAAEARVLSDHKGVHHLLVMDGPELVGILCRCDLEWALDGDSAARRIRTPVATLAGNDSTEIAARVMLERGLGCLPVLDALGTVRGVVTRSDLRHAGALPGERGVDCCAACGAGHCLSPVTCPDTPVFCCDCLDQVREKGVRELYLTLGGGD
jgi:predicted transcriptional regulator